MLNFALSSILKGGKNAFSIYPALKALILIRYDPTDHILDSGSLNVPHAQDRSRECDTMEAKMMKFQALSHKLRSN